MTKNAQLSGLVIEKPTLDDVEGYRRVQARGWLDAYPNEEAGVSLEWVKQRTESWLTPKELELSRERVRAMLEDSEHQFLYVAKVKDQPVGMVCASKIDGNQRLEAIYIDKEYQGTGLAQELLDRGLANLNPKKPITLEVIAYNKRAQRFYQKNGFEIVPGSDHLYKDVMPSVVMVRPAGDNHEI